MSRERSRAFFHVTKVLVDKTRQRNAKGVLEGAVCNCSGKTKWRRTGAVKTSPYYLQSEDGKLYVYQTNNFTLPASQIATIYKNRWMIELLFKQIKQNFPLRYFWGESPNAIKMQVYCVLIAQLLMVVIRKKAATKKSFANMITVIRLHLSSYVELLAFIKDSYKAWRRTYNPVIDFSP